MDGAKKRRKNLIQNAAIVLLFVSAAALFTQTQLYNLGVSGGYLSGLLPDRAAAAEPGVSLLTDLSVPVRVAVTGAYGRYGDLALATGEDGFSQLGSLLREALGSAGEPELSDPAAFRAALGSAADYGLSVYYDFDAPLPLPVLAGLVGAEWTGRAVGASRVLLSAEESAVTLYLWDGADNCHACSTAVTPAALEKLAEDYQLGGAFFALDQGEGYAHLDPFSLFTDPMAQPAALSAASALNDTDAVLTALAFNAHTNNRYPEASGAEVVVEADRTLRLHPDGTIVYQGTGGELAVAAAGESPTAAEAALGAYRMLASLLSGIQTDARLYLQGIRSGEQAMVLTFDYQVDGLPVRFSDGGPAAQVTLEGTAVTELSLRLRQYTAAEGQSLLLPLAQALSISRAYPGAELVAAYVDDGGGSPSAQWLAE